MAKYSTDRIEIRLLRREKKISAIKLTQKHYPCSQSIGPIRAEAAYSDAFFFYIKLFLIEKTSCTYEHMHILFCRKI